FTPFFSARQKQLPLWLFSMHPHPSLGGCRFCFFLPAQNTKTRGVMLFRGTSFFIKKKIFFFFVFFLFITFFFFFFVVFFFFVC
ncbi:hypothetical protein DV030_17285, partial [Lacticaseibacillus paracasei]|nr:hypothetical protein [Lacticaseibacillus paracasei]